MSNHTGPVVFHELNTDCGFNIGRATLTKMAALNALDLDMIKLLYPQLKKWQEDPSIAMVILDGEGDRAFCAGGDIVSMYHLMELSIDGTNKVDEDRFTLQEFFTLEYELDYLIHTYKKPILVWGNGIAMGGGMGLMCGASHRIVTPNSRLAMPEISIGLYPDVGASYFLNKMPAGCGLFLGLTGASINASDALYANLADYFVSHDSKSALMQSLLSANWQVGALAQTLDSICDDFHNQCQEQLPISQLEINQNWLTGLSSFKDLSGAVNYINSASSQESKWLSKAQQALINGSAISAHIVFEQLRRGKNMSLAECFQMELGVSCKGGEFGEFKEGVRALLIDKDGKPSWKYAGVKDVPQSTVDFFFEPIWTEETHPLAHIS